MKTTFLDFEQPIAELEQKIEELRFVQDDSAVDISQEIERLSKKSRDLTKDIYGKLNAWQISKVARHPAGPYTLDYIAAMCTDFEEMHGDRSFADDAAIVGGLARFNGQSVMVLGHQKGRDTNEKILRNFGMPRPEGYRKALRLMKLAEKFAHPAAHLRRHARAPIPGIGAEERGQSEAIGRNLYEMAGLRVPIVVSIIGEGGSGGALAIAVGDTTLMMQYSTYSVISPEGCAAILWKSPENAAEAAECLGITAPRLKALGLVDKIVNEPLGGAHRDPAEAAQEPQEGHRGPPAPAAGPADHPAPRAAPGPPRGLRQVQGAGGVARGARAADGRARAFPGGAPGPRGRGALAARVRPGQSRLRGLLRRPRFHRAPRPPRAASRRAGLRARRAARPPRALAERRPLGRGVRGIRGSARRAASRRARGGRSRSSLGARGGGAASRGTRPSRARARTSWRSRTTATTRPRPCSCRRCAAPGMKGLSGDGPRRGRVGGAVWLRPLLDEPREALFAHARAAGLDWVEDESNELTAFDRNFLRHEVMPVLERRFPQYRESLARLARHAASASELLETLAREDAERIAEGGGISAAGLARARSACAAPTCCATSSPRAGCRCPATRGSPTWRASSLTARDDARVLLLHGGRALVRHRGVHPRRGSAAPGGLGDRLAGRARNCRWAPAAARCAS